MAGMRGRRIGPAALMLAVAVGCGSEPSPPRVPSLQADLFRAALARSGHLTVTYDVVGGSPC